MILVASKTTCVLLSRVHEISFVEIACLNEALTHFDKLLSVSYSLKFLSFFIIYFVSVSKSNDKQLFITWKSLTYNIFGIKIFESFDSFESIYSAYSSRWFPATWRRWHSWFRFFVLIGWRRSAFMLHCTRRSADPDPWSSRAFHCLFDLSWSSLVAKCYMKFLLNKFLQ